MASVHADTLYRTSFEQPTFLPGVQLSGLDGWTTAIPPFLNSTAASITNTAARSGNQSVEVTGGELVSAPEVSPYDAVAISRRPLDVAYDTAATGNKKLARIDADLMLATTKPRTPGQFFSQTISARAGDAGLGEIGLSSKGVVEAWAFDAGPGDVPLAKCTKSIRFNKWYHLTMLINFADNNRTTSYFIDEHFLCSTPSPRNTVLLRGAMGVFARPDGGDEGGPGSVRNDYTARFDKFRISVHNETPDID